MKKIWKFIKNRLSFHVMDAVGMLVAAILIISHPDTQSLFYTLGEPTLYLSLLLVAFLGRSLYWLLVLRAEAFYFKHSVFGFFADFIRLVIVTLCVTGTYLLLITFL